MPTNTRQGTWVTVPLKLDRKMDILPCFVNIDCPDSTVRRVNSIFYHITMSIPVVLEQIVVSVDEKRRSLRHAVANFRFGLQDIFSGSQLLHMGYANGGNYPNIRADTQGQIVDFSKTAHTHFKNRRLGGFCKTHNRPRQSDFIVFIAQGFERLISAHQNRRRHILGRCLPHTAGDTYTVEGKPLSVIGGYVQKGPLGIRDYQDILIPQWISRLHRVLGHTGYSPCFKSLGKKSMAVKTLPYAARQTGCPADGSRVSVLISSTSPSLP